MTSEMREEVSTELLGRRDTVLGTIMDSLYDGVYIADRMRRIIFWNAGAKSITGYSFEEVRGRRCADDILNHIDENGDLLCKRKCPLLGTLKTGIPVEAKVYPLHKTGKRVPTMTHIAPIHDKDGAIIAAIEVFRDISVEEDFHILQEKFNGIVKKYLSAATLEHVMEQIHRGNGGTSCMRDLTVLYLDIVGFTPFSEMHSPDDVVCMLNEIFGLCEIITNEYHGDIDKFIGDAIMAVFPDANDAVGAGGKILEALSLLNRQRTEEGKQRIDVRIGINSGIVLQGNIGTANRKDLTIIGDAVNTAARIQQVALPNTIAISESTWSRLRQQELFIRGEQVDLKGKAEPIAIYSLGKP